MSLDDQSLSDRFPKRVSHWQLRTRKLSFSQLPLLMGIVNVTPDSFSDGGKFFDPELAIEHALRLVSEGADILDIGGESTRPYAEPVSVHDELARVLPVIESLAATTQVPISIDTTKAIVAEAALSFGVEIINDITGFSSDPAMRPLAAEWEVGVCAMHMQGSPQTMQDDPRYEDVIEDIREYLLSRCNVLLQAGIAPERICLDPGIGFGKTHQHNLTLMANCWQFHELGCPLLVGHSRKGFLGKVIDDKTADRTAATVGSALSLARQGVQIVRLHDVRPVREALLAFAATGGIDGTCKELAES